MEFLLNVEGLTLLNLAGLVSQRESLRGLVSRRETLRAKNFVF
jgi:hypothetical protein